MTCWGWVDLFKASNRIHCQVHNTATLDYPFNLSPFLSPHKKTSPYWAISLMSFNAMHAEQHISLSLWYPIHKFPAGAHKKFLSDFKWIELENEQFCPNQSISYLLHSWWQQIISSFGFGPGGEVKKQKVFSAAFSFFL